MSNIYYFILIPMVYIAFAIFLSGIIFRTIQIAISPKRKASPKIFPGKKPYWLIAFYDSFIMPAVKKHNLRRTQIR